MPSGRHTLLICALLPLCWLWMQIVHELGHVGAAWGTGGQVTRVVLHPATISRTDVDPNPWPLIVTWAGPLVGVLFPLLLLAAMRRAAPTGRAICRFFAGFCLIANGAYLGVGSFTGIGDAGDLLRYGAPAWQLWLFGVTACAAGLALWHGLGPHFGLGKDPRPVSQRTAYVYVGLLLLTLAAELLLSPRG